jgi:hypothetical protein
VHGQGEKIGSARTQTKGSQGVGSHPLDTQFDCQTHDSKLTAMASVGAMQHDTFPAGFARTGHRGEQL